MNRRHRRTLRIAVALLAFLAFSRPASAAPPGSRQTDSFGTTWHEIGVDNFNRSASRGTFASDSPTKVVYVGDHGLRWTENPDWGCGTASRARPYCYEPAKVLSVHDGHLDFWLHSCRYPDGYYGACGADPGPLSPETGTRYQTYGRYDARARVVYNDANRLDTYHMAWLLWPKLNADAPCAESDFPELQLDRPDVYAFTHGCGKSFRRFTRGINMTKWHTYSQEWGPGYRRYYVDGKLLGQTKTEVWAHPERWQLQISALIKTSAAPTSGHVLVNWVWLGKLRRGG